MKATIRLFFYLSLIVVVSCQDYRYDNMVNDSVYFLHDGVQTITINVDNDSDYIHTVWLHKAGFFQNKFVGKIELDYNYLVIYNNDNNTNYEMLSDDYFDLDRSFVIEDHVNSTSITITLKIQDILTDYGYTKVFVPLVLKSSTYQGDVSDDKSKCLFVFDLTN